MIDTKRDALREILSNIRVTAPAGFVGQLSRAAWEWDDLTTEQLADELVKAGVTLSQAEPSFTCKCDLPPTVECEFPFCEVGHRMREAANG